MKKKILFITTLALGLFFNGCKDSATAEQLYNRADSLASVAETPEQWQEIEKLLSRSLRQNKENMSALLLRGYAYYRLDKMREAVEDFRMAKSYATLDPLTLYWNGWIYHKLGEQGDNKAYATAIAFLREALTNCPASSDDMKKSLLVMLVNCCLVTGSPGGEKYIAELQKYDSMKRRPELYNAKGIFQFREQQYSDASKNFNIADTLDKNNMIYCENMAILQAKYLRNNVEARKWYAKAIRSANIRKDKDSSERLTQIFSKFSK